MKTMKRLASGKIVERGDVPRVFGSPAAARGRAGRAPVARILALAVFGGAISGGGIWPGGGGKAMGQVQVPQGRALDANPQVGSGGSNTPVAGYVPINGNNVIWGNVGSLSYFHGRVGSSNPDVFQGPLGSASLDAFARQSAPPGPGFAPSLYIAPSTVVSTGQGYIHPTPTANGFYSTVVPSASQIPQAPPTPQLRINQDFGEELLRSGQVTLELPEDSGAYLFTNPLFFSQQGTPELNPQEKIQRKNPEKSGSEEGTQNPAAAQGSGSNTATGESAINGTGVVNGANGTGTAATDNTPPRLQAPMPDLGTATSTSTYNPRAPRSDLSPFDARNNPALLATNARKGAPPIQVSDTYKALLAELQESQRAAEAKAKLAGPEPKVAANNVPPKNPADRERPPVAGRTLEDEPVSTLRAGQNVKPLKTLTEVPKGMAVTPFDTQMQSAEKLLKEGKYLDAMDAYDGALDVQPENALALVGRAHAELGAGMYQSAAFDLKMLFTHKPAMIGVRYSLDTFIPEQRLNELSDDLLRMTTQEKMGNMASFLYCYISYNMERNEPLQQELDRWGYRKGHDEWQAVAKKAWGK